MCGLTGIISSDHHNAIVAMTRSLTHRGPDGEGFHYGDGVALGHRRLSIIDIDGGQQPISDSSDQIHLVCNGEIYNSPALRRTLKAEGYAFKTSTDVEVILPLYLKHGRDCVKHLRGMFAFALWDERNRSLVLARDHMGQKPLFFCRQHGRFLFASEPKAIMASGLVQPEIELDALWHYISLRYIPDQYSLFKGIEKLPAATTLTWRENNASIERYWIPSFTDKFTSGEAELTDNLDDLLKSTVDVHTLSDVPVGAFLSGGIDSSTIAAMMARSSSDPITSFSIGVKEQSFNELPFARAVAQRYGMQAKERIAKADLVHLLPTMIDYMDEPTDPFGIGVFLVSKLASEHVKVALSGDGGDENFAGYDRYAGQKLVDYYCMLPEAFRKHVMRRAISVIPESFEYKSIAQKARWVNEMSFYSDGARYSHSMSFLRFTAADKERLFSEHTKGLVEDRNSESKLLKYFSADNVSDVVDRMLYTDLMTRIPDHLLTIADRMSMAHGLESRPVLVDREIVEFAARVPANLKLNGKNLKYILKRVAARYLPDELITRKKQGFSFPLGHWLRTDLRGFVEDLFAQSRFVELGIFEPRFMKELLDEHTSGKVDHNYRLWILINLEIWYRLKFESETVDSMREFTDELMARAK